MYTARQIHAKRRLSRSSDHEIAIWRQFSCTLRQCTWRKVDRDADTNAVWIRGGVCCCVPGGVGAGEGGAGAPCGFQRLRLGGKALDGELARLVPRAVLTSARTDAVSPLRARVFPPAPLSQKAEFRPHSTFPLSTTSALAPPSPPHHLQPGPCERRGPFLLTGDTWGLVRKHRGLILFTDTTSRPFC